MDAEMKLAELAMNALATTPSVAGTAVVLYYALRNMLRGIITAAVDEAVSDLKHRVGGLEKKIDNGITHAIEETRDEVNRIRGYIEAQKA